MKNFRKNFDYEAKKIFEIKDLSNLGDAKISTSVRLLSKTGKIVFFNKLIIEVPIDTNIDYINPEEWYLECHNRINEYLLKNIDNEN